MGSKFTARHDNVCIKCGEVVVGHAGSGEGKGHAIHWPHGKSAKPGQVYHCAADCCGCFAKGDQSYGLGLRAPGLKPAEDIRTGGGEGDGDGKPTDKGQGEGSDSDDTAEQGEGSTASGDGDMQSGPEWTMNDNPPTEGGEDLSDQATDEIEQRMEDQQDASSGTGDMLRDMLEKIATKAATEASDQAQEQLADAMQKLQADHDQRVSDRDLLIDKAQQQVEDLQGENKDLEQKLEDAEAGSKFTVERPDGTTASSDDDHYHQNFEDLLALALSGLLVCMVGKPGGGKSWSAEQLANVLGIPYRGHHSLHPLSSPHELMGMRYADGTYYPTPYREAWEHGGVVLVDEVFNSSPQMQARMNSMLANGQGDFPDRMVNKHDDCIVVTADNTYGMGGDWMFPERRPADAAFRNRFVFLDWPYDEPLENKLSLMVHDDAMLWVEWVQKVRAYCETNMVPLIVSPRTSYQGIKLLANTGWEYSKIAELTLFKGIDETTFEGALKAVPFPDKRPVRLHSPNDPKCEPEDEEDFDDEAHEDYLQAKADGEGRVQ